MSKRRPGKRPTTGPHIQPTAPAVAQPASPLPLSWGIWLILGVTAIVYSRAMWNGFTSFDDDFYIVNNPFLRDFSLHGLKGIFSSYYQSNYHPLTTLTYFIEYHFFGLNPLPYHLLNVLLHLLNTWLVYVLVKQLSGKPLTALITSALFALHPMHVESVAWVSERKDVLYAAFYLAATLAYLRYLTAPAFSRYLVVTLIFVCSLLSKSAAVTLPVLLLVIDVYKGRHINAGLIIEKTPWLVLSLTFGIVNLLAQKAGGPVLILFREYGIVNAFFLFTSGIALYLIRAIVPFSLSAMHYFPFLHERGLPVAYFLSLPLLVLLGWFVFRKWKNTHLKKDLLFGMAFFFVTISVMLQVVSVGSALTAERYTYIAYIGLFYFFGQWLGSIRTGDRMAPARYIAGAAMIVFLFQTWDRIAVWKDDESLLTDVIQKNSDTPDINYIYLLRGNYHTAIHDYRDAVEDYNQAISINKYFSFAYDAYYERGKVYDMTGDMKMAMDDYTRSIELNPKFANAFDKRGWVYFRNGDNMSAMNDYSMAIKLKPDFAEAYNNRGWLYDNMGDLPNALKDYNKAISLDPDFQKPYFNRAAVYARGGKFQEALADYNYILKIHPNDPNGLYYHGLVMMNLNNQSAACSDWRKAADLGHELAEKMLRQKCR